jgi:hypothetical protein
MPSLRLRPTWWLVMWGLSASLSLNFVLPAFDHHAVEYSPFHSHVILGARSAAEREQALAEHQHGAGQPHTHAPADTGAGASSAASAVAWPNPTPLVFATGGWLEGLLALSAAGAPDLLVSLDWSAPQPVFAVWFALLPAALFFLLRTSPPPIQPPRPA